MTRNLALESRCRAIVSTASRRRGEDAVPRALHAQVLETVRKSLPLQRPAHPTRAQRYLASPLSSFITRDVTNGGAHM